MRNSANSLPILCHVTPWYFRRMLLVTLILGAGAASFLYDWGIGYPKANEIASKKEWFDQTWLPSYEQAKRSNNLAQWEESAKRKGLPVGRDGDSPRWISYAAQQGWPQEPRRYSVAEISAQLGWSAGCFGAAIIAFWSALVHRGRVLSGHPHHLVTPNGRRVNYQDITRIDLRAWESKGLAYLWHRSKAGAAEKRIVIDDLKYGGADRVLELVLAQFRGPILTADPPNPPPAAAPANEPTPPSPPAQEPENPRN